MPAVNLPPEIERRLDTVCRKTGRTRDGHMREAILDYLEDFEDAALVEARLAAGRQGGETIDLAELLKRYGLDADGGTTG